VKISEHIKQCDEVSVLTILFGIRFHRSEDPGFNQNVLEPRRTIALQKAAGMDFGDVSDIRYIWLRRKEMGISCLLQATAH